MEPRVRYCIFVSAAAVVVIFIIGILIGYFSAPRSSSSGPASATYSRDADPSISEKLINEIKGENMDRYLKEWTAAPHVAGTPADIKTAQTIQKHWQDAGLDEAKIYSYSILLSYPNETAPNKVQILNGAGNVEFTSLLKEPTLRPEDKIEDTILPFNAYGAAGRVEAEVVYVNYGRESDFDFLKKNKSIDVTGKICLMRYGKRGRGDKAFACQDKGGVGVILFSDPMEVAVNDSLIYPNGWFMPPGAVQRGSTKKSSGDPLTPIWPAIESAYRISQDEALIPKIPIQPIGYGDAEVILRNMSGDAVEPSWQGGIKNTIYKYGPGLINGKKLRLEVNNYREMKTSYDVIAYIRGAIEPDRYVFFGNHRDAWSLGAADPTGGTSVTLEVSRAYGALLKSGWRPRRTIMFGSWGAEEYGLIGSVEWVEQFSKILGDRTVAYLNMDVALRGAYVYFCRGSPLLKQPIFAASKKVPNPDPKEIQAGRKSVYDTWLFRDESKTNPGEPTYAPLSYSGSDYAPFQFFVGIAVADSKYNYDKSYWKTVPTYPLYHSAYETYYYMGKIMDPGMKFNEAVGRVFGEVMRNIVDSLILPMKVKDYFAQFDDYGKAFMKSYEALLTANGIDVKPFKEASIKFGKAADAFEKRLETLDKNDPFAVRHYNDQIMQLERAFINPYGLPGRKQMKHVIFAPNEVNVSSDKFSGIADAIYEIESITNADDKKAKWRIIKEQFSILIYLIEGAAHSLKEPSLF